MREITKGQPPASLQQWVRAKPRDKNANQWFQELYAQKKNGISLAISASSALRSNFISVLIAAIA